MCIYNNNECPACAYVYTCTYLSITLHDWLVTIIGFRNRRTAVEVQRRPSQPTIMAPWFSWPKSPVLPELRTSRSRSVTAKHAQCWITVSRLRDGSSIFKCELPYFPLQLRKTQCIHLLLKFWPYDTKLMKLIHVGCNPNHKMVSIGDPWSRKGSHLTEDIGRIFWVFTFMESIIKEIRNYEKNTCTSKSRMNTGWYIANSMKIFSALPSFKVAMIKQRCFAKIKLGSCLVAPYRLFCKPAAAQSPSTKQAGFQIQNPHGHTQPHVWYSLYE